MEACLYTVIEVYKNFMDGKIALYRGNLFPEWTSEVVLFEFSEKEAPPAHRRGR